MPAVDPDHFSWDAPTGPAADVRRIVGAADAADGVANLNEAALLHLKNRGLEGATLLLEDDGLALLRGDELDVVVTPEARGAGLGGRLVEAAIGDRQGPLEAWSHADHPAAARLAERFEMTRARELWVMERALDETLPEVPDLADVRVRGFRTADTARLIEVNAAAFAQHPEQGQMDEADFAARTSEDWFDPAGLLVAADADDVLIGFHWTKVHSHPAPLGEVYVVAVSPRAAGRGIGRLLTAAGLQHLRGQGLERVQLYVEADNDPAIAVYRGTGFERARVEAQYLR